MKWVSHGEISTCAISDSLVAFIQEWKDRKNQKWIAGVDMTNGESFDFIGDFPTEAAAKSAVAAWIGKTMAQLSNALAAGETYPDDGA